MKLGDIVLIPFPFAELTQLKARPAAVLAETADKYQDLIVTAISSVIPATLSRNEFIVLPGKENGLRVRSVVKTDRIVTTKKEQMIVHLGRLSDEDCAKLVAIFQNLVKE